jgi:putative ABC transport system permease protein
VSASIAPSRLLPADLARIGAVGLRTRRLRAALSALGIAIGIASMVAVLGISESSKSDLLAELDRLGTNLLTVQPGETFGGESATLPDSAPKAIGRIGGVGAVAPARTLDATVRRTDRIPAEETGGLGVVAADPALLRTLGGSMTRGRFLDAATGRVPAVVLGSVAAERLGIDRLGVLVYIDGRWFAVAGIMAPLTLAPDLDRSVLVGFDAAESLLGEERSASVIYLRPENDAVERARGLLPSTANPANPEEINVSRPSDALEARAAAKSAFTGLFLGLGAVALLVGGIGIANTMVISVLERRSEIGLRRALGATKGHIRGQFLSESLLLAALGGLAGLLAGALVTLGYAASQGWTAVVPPAALGGGLGAALLIGAVAGLYPAARAARLSPTDALRSV